MRKVYIHPRLPEGPDPGNGGIGRVILGQHQGLPDHGWEVVDDPAAADVLAYHVQIPEQDLMLYPDKPIVAHNHGAYWHPDYPWGREWCYEANRNLLRAVRAADVTTAVSEWTASTLRRHSNRDVRVVHHGVDLDEWQLTPPDERGDYVLWNKTRVDPICDPGPMNELAAIMPQTRFVSTHGNPAANVTITGTLPFLDGKRLVEQAGIYLCTTRETFGVGTLEALACGVPVVGFNWGGQWEFIENKVDGWLVAPGDIQGLAEGVQWALANREQIAERARAKAEQFPVSRSAAQYAQIYDELANRYEAQARQPKVSVIVPAYKMGDYLEACLDSVKAQTLDDWECIVVDDASPDDRDRAIAEGYAATDPRFRYIRHDENRYLAAARNTGIAAARGRYIMPLDADDQLAPNALKLLADALDGDRRIDTAYGGVRFVHEDGMTPVDRGHIRGPGYSGWPVHFLLGEMFARLQEGPGQPLPYASMYRRRVWELTGGYRERCETSEDQDFWIRTASYGFVPQMVTQADTLIYRERDDSMSKQRGWVNHAGWYPWIREELNTALPAAADRGAVANHLIAFPALEPMVVSVVIPVGPGHERYVVDAVDSVDAQTFRLWECIVVNDSGEPLPPLPTWVRVFETEEEGSGVAVARNLGLSHARGSLFLPLDADDYLQPAALELMVDAYLDGRDAPADALSGTNPPGFVYSDWFEDKGDPKAMTIWRADNYDADLYVKRGMFHAVTALTPMRFWRELGGYTEGIAWEDWDFAIRIAAKGWCGRRVAAPLFVYRKHTGMRAGENFADFEQSKAAIMAQPYENDGGKLMACRTCGSARSAQTYQMTVPSAAGPEGGTFASQGVMVRYLGNLTGKWNVKGNKGPNGEPPHLYYVTAKRREFYIDRRDISVFEGRVEFEFVEGRPSAASVSQQQPALVAAGAPGHVHEQSPPQQQHPPLPEAPPPPPSAGLAQMPTPPPAPTAPPSTDAGESPPPMVAASAASDTETPEPATNGASEEPAIEVPSGWISEPEAKRMNRDVLDAYAESKGVEAPDRLPNKDAVWRAVRAMAELNGVQVGA